MRLLMLATYLVLIIVGVSFAALNAVTVQVNFYFTTLSLPLSVLMTLMLGIGLLVGFVLSVLKYWRLKVQCLAVKNQLKLREKEIQNLRAIPLRDQH
jgi:putative membrane protein